MLHNGMSLIKILPASQAPYINQYKNTRRKILNCNANINFNQEYIKRNIIPQYATIKVPHTSLAKKFTQTKTQQMRIKEEIKFCYIYIYI
jgi:hypothetical protein